MRLPEIGALLALFATPELEHLAGIDLWCGPGWTVNEDGHPTGIHLTVSPRVHPVDAADMVETLAEFLGSKVETAPMGDTATVLTSTGVWAELRVTVSAVIHAAAPGGRDVIDQYAAVPVPQPLHEWIDDEACASGRDESW